jgi:hypothetical protein
MSLPLSRRIVQAAFVVAAGAVPAVLTGVAHAAPALPAVPDLGGLSQVDGSGLGGQVQSTTHQTGQIAGNGTGETVADTVPAVADTAGDTAAKALPQANRMLGSTTGELTRATGSTGATRAMPADAPSTGSATGALSALPLGSLPVNSLPLGAATSTLSGVTDPNAAPATQRLGGLPSLGDTSGLGSVTQALPLGGGALPIG